MPAHIEEAKRYIHNAKDIVKTKLRKRDGFYNDPKYVRMAGNTAWGGVLEALTPLVAGKKNRINVADYKAAIAKKNKKALTTFNEAYNYLHLFAGYDGSLKETTLKVGFELAEDMIRWAENNLPTGVKK